VESFPGLPITSYTMQQRRKPNLAKIAEQRRIWDAPKLKGGASLYLLFINDEKNRTCAVAQASRVLPQGMLGMHRLHRSAFLTPPRSKKK
ncbi:MAG: hypothetical protein Q9169_008744, partial [Polycauliona sp. 2 TL-2023]